jgi:two-component system phosphate regulon sensor histidine kinase PhoR
MFNRLGIRTRLFLISFIIIVIVGLIGGIWLESELVAWLESRIQSELVQDARIFAQVMENSTAAGSVEETDRITDELGQNSVIRYTVIADDGTVIGDSDVATADIGAMENHADRPEFIQAKETGIGIAQRYSYTLSTRMLYVAVPFENESGNGVVRVAMPLSEVNTAVARLRWFIWIAGLLFVGVALVMSALASQLMSARMRSLLTYAHTVSEGKLRPGFGLNTGDEIGGIAGSINILSENLEGVFSELATERDYLHAVLEGMDDGVLAVDSNRQITLVNSAGMKMMELKTSPVGKSITDVVRAPAILNVVMESAGDKSISTEFDLPVSESRRILAAITPLKAEGGWVIVMRDVTQIRKLETARRDFYANASHELRTPVGIIHANVETLLSGAIDEKKTATEFLEAIHRSSLRLTNLLNDLLQISRIEEGRYEPDIIDIDLARAVDRSIESVSQMARDKNILIKNDVPDDVKAMGDPNALDEVLVNILENAVKYTPEGGHVAVRASREGENVAIGIEDDGPGIPPKHRTRIFERFYRVDPGRSREMGGTGLGLAIVKYLVTAMHGEVRMEPGSKGGSVFIVTLKGG